ncbi:PrpF domain-containing protein [Kitasatospora sp. NPDC002543]
MIGHVVYAHGSPCPTLVLDARRLPREEQPLLDRLAAARKWLDDAGAGHILKIALVEPAEHPLFDLDYRFVQALPSGPAAFDLRGSCGHSILGSIVAGAESGSLPRLTPGMRVRVMVRNNGDHIVCEITEVRRDSALFDIHFVQPAPKPLGELLLAGAATTTVDVDGAPVPVSLVSMGNPYAFVAASTLGLSRPEDLFADDRSLFDRLVRIRRAAAVLLGWPPDGAFPKVAAVMAADDGRIAVRAISVPTWHPTIALTGAACVAAAVRIKGTTPWVAAQQAGVPDGTVDILTAGGLSSVAATVRNGAYEPELTWTTVRGKRTTTLGSFPIEPLASLQPKELTACLSLSR